MSTPIASKLPSPFNTKRNSWLKFPIRLLLEEELYIGKYSMWNEEEMENLDDIARKYRYTHPLSWELNEIFLGIKPIEIEGKISPRDIEKVKQVPIDKFLIFKAKFAKCIWHNEKTASMHWYQDSNRVTCFGCNHSDDVIGVIRKLKGVDFNSAVKYLLGR